RLRRMSMALGSQSSAVIRRRPSAAETDSSQAPVRAALKTGEASLRWRDETRKVIAAFSSDGDVVGAEEAGLFQTANGASGLLMHSTTSPSGSIVWLNAIRGWRIRCTLYDKTRLDWLGILRYYTSYGWYVVFE